MKIKRKALIGTVIFLIISIVMSLSFLNVFAKETGALVKVNGYTSSLLSLVGGNAEIKDNSELQGVNVSIKGDKSEAEIIFNEKLNFNHIMASFNLNTFEANTKPQIAFNINDSENRESIKSSNYISVVFDVVSKKEITVSLNLVKPDGKIIEKYEVTKCNFFPNTYENNSDLVNMQFSLGLDKKFAFGMPGVQDGSEVDFLSFKTNKILSIAQESEIYPNALPDSIYYKVMSLKDKQLFLSMNVKEKSELVQNISLDLLQIGTFNFYDHYKAPSAQLQSEESLNYSKINIKWETKLYESLNHQGYILERFRNGSTVPEIANTYLSKASSSFNDTFLKQDVDYVYKVSAYANLELPVKILVIEYDSLSLKTKKGNIWPFILGIAGFIVIFAVITAIYVNWYSIKKGKKKKIIFFK